MILLSLIKEAFSALWVNRLRSVLTIVGMVMGVTSVIAIVSTVEGMQKNMVQTFESMGPNTFMVSRIGFAVDMKQYLERLKRKKLNRHLIDPLREGCPDCEDIGAEGYASDHLKYGAQGMSWVQVTGETPNMLAIREKDVVEGRYFSWEDDHRRAKVAFIGGKVKDKLFPNEDPIGKRIRIGPKEFTVIGVAESVGGLFGDEADEFVSIPLATHQSLYPKPGNPVNLVIRAASMESRERAMDQVRVVLRTIRRVDYEKPDDFEIFTPDAILSFINNITRAFRVLVVSLPLLSIVIGGIVIMNIMMISVSERTREIGIRKSIGARRRHVLLQFLYESLILSLVGGLLGATFGILLGRTVLTSLLDIHVSATALGLILGLGISTGVGLFFGIYPAWKASRLDPIKALSYE
ncbi:MAG TPA: ABC transporter permease [bacterium]|nr:ABC transporter permease [bacterium]